jgi:hypothetical protein
MNDTRSLKKGRSRWTRKALHLIAGHVDAARGDDAKAGFLQHRGDRAGEVAPRGRV